MDKDFNFIKTTDESVRDKLLNLGFTMVDESNGCWTFLNSKSPATFDLKDSKKITLTNIISV